MVALMVGVDERSVARYAVINSCVANSPAGIYLFFSVILTKFSGTVLSSVSPLNLGKMLDILAHKSGLQVLLQSKLWGHRHIAAVGGD